jgi:hypothetical protein
MNSECRIQNDELSVFEKIHALFLVIAFFACMAILSVMVWIEMIGDCFAAKRKSAARNDMVACDTEGD